MARLVARLYTVVSKSDNLWSSAVTLAKILTATNPGITRITTTNVSPRDGSTKFGRSSLRAALLFAFYPSSLRLRNLRPLCVLVHFNNDSRERSNFSQLVSRFKSIFVVIYMGQVIS